MTELHPLLADTDPRLWPLSEQDLDLPGIDIVVNTHLHGDHCGGNPHPRPPARHQRRRPEQGADGGPARAPRVARPHEGLHVHRQRQRDPELRSHRRPRSSASSRKRSQDLQARQRADRGPRPDARQLRAVVRDRPKGFGDKPDTYHSDAVFLMGIDAPTAMKVFDPRPGVDEVWPGKGVIYSQRLSAQRTKSRLGKIVGTPGLQVDDDPQLGRRSVARGRWVLQRGCHRPPQAEIAGCEAQLASAHDRNGAGRAPCAR